MRTIVKVQPKGQMTIPRRVRAAVGLADGDMVEVRAVGNKIVIIPQVGSDRFSLANADDYTPEQRRVVDARLAEAEKGPYFGPFRTGAEVAAFLKKKTERRARPAKLKNAG